MPDDDDIYDMTDNPLADADADPQGVDDVDPRPEAQDAAPAAGDQPQPEPTTTTDAPSADPVAQKPDEAPAPTVGALDGLSRDEATAVAAIAAQYGVPVERVAQDYREQQEAARAAAVHEQVAQSMRPLLEQLWAKVNAGEMSEEAAGEVYYARLEAAQAKAEAEAVKARLAESDRRATVERNRPEFPGQAVGLAVEALAAKGATASELRDLAAAMHGDGARARENAVAQYNARRAKTPTAHRPAVGAAPDPSGPPADFDNIDAVSYADLFGV